MMEYFDFADLKALIIGIVGALIVLAMQRLWLFYTVRGVERRLKETEAEKTKMEQLSSSDTALMIYCFQGVFGLIAILCLIFAIQTSLFLNPEPPEKFLSIDLRELMHAILWLVPAMIAVSIVITLQRINDHPKYMDTLEKRIARLREKVARNRRLPN